MLDGQTDRCDSMRATTQFVTAAAQALQSAQRPLIVSGTGAMSRAVLVGGGPHHARAARKDTGHQTAARGARVQQRRRRDARRRSHARRCTDDAPSAAPPKRSSCSKTICIGAHCPNASRARWARSIWSCSTASRRARSRPRHSCCRPRRTSRAKARFVNYEGRAQRLLRGIRTRESDPSGVALDFGSGRRARSQRTRLASHRRRRRRVRRGGRVRRHRRGGADRRTTAAPRRVACRARPHRYSGRTAMYADHTMHEPKASVDEESPLAFSMEGANTGEVGALIPYVWAPGWNSNQAVTRFQLEVGGRLRGGDPGRAPDSSDARAPNDWPEARPTRRRRCRDAGISMLPLHEIFGSDELSGAVATDSASGCRRRTSC